mmetsp:Transcript_25643/g.59797  ORF Transcript_25643/g.59797 Transcript_25643/m.59797 type:complete len:564 (+) Transcript_25643:86-1777(+)
MHRSPPSAIMVVDEGTAAEGGDGRTALEAVNTSSPGRRASSFLVRAAFSIVGNEVVEGLTTSTSADESKGTTVNDACSYVQHSLLLTMSIAVAGVLLGSLPFSLVFNFIGEEMLRKSEASNVTESGYVILRSETTDPFTWSEGYAGGGPGADLAAGCIAVYAMMGFPWLSVFAISSRVNGWSAMHGKVLFVVVVCFLVHASMLFLYFVMLGSDSAGPTGVAVLKFGWYPALIVGICTILMGPFKDRLTLTNAKWMMMCLFVLMISEYFIRTALKVYFLSELPTTRIVLRSVMLPLIKYVSLHLYLVAVEHVNFTHDEHSFLFLTLPMGLVVATSSVMQLAAANPTEALVMQLIVMVGELLEYRTYLRGKTHIQKWIDKARWLLRQGTSTVAPAVAPDAKPEAAEASHVRERVHLLSGLAVMMGIMEGSASVMTFALFLMCPINPSKVGAPADKWDALLVLWLISFVFEVIVPEAVLAYFSRLIARVRDAGTYGDVVAVVNSDMFGRENSIVIGMVTICAVSYMYRLMLQVLCPTPFESTGEGLMAFSACCSDEVEGAVPCDGV